MESLDGVKGILLKVTLVILGTEHLRATELTFYWVCIDNLKNSEVYSVSKMLMIYKKIRQSKEERESSKWNVGGEWIAILGKFVRLF